MASHPKYGREWREDILLDGGARVRLRLVRAEDKPKFVAGLARLSEESQYLRFFTSKVKFTESELRYLTELDGVDHLAIAVALVRDDDTEGDGVGIGRFVRLVNEPEVAEPAIVVIDELQGHGLGRLLMERLIEAAVERGVKRFRSEFLAINRPMKELLVHLSPAAQFTSDGPIVTAEFSLVSETDAPASWRSWPIYEWFRLAAQKTVAMRRQFGGLFDPDTVKAMIARWRAADDDEPG